MEKAPFLKPFPVKGVCAVEIVTGRRSSYGFIARHVAVEGNAARSQLGFSDRASSPTTFGTAKDKFYRTYPRLLTDYWPITSILISATFRLV